MTRNSLYEMLREIAAECKKDKEQVITKNDILTFIEIIFKHV